MLAEGARYNEIKEKLDTTAPTISRWKKRYREETLMVWRRCIQGSLPAN